MGGDVIAQRKRKTGFCGTCFRLDLFLDGVAYCFLAVIESSG